jgi:hypothetical protein
MNILITVPHSVCINNENHLCDYLSLDAAKNLGKYFNEYSKNVYILPADKIEKI